MLPGDAEPDVAFGLIVPFFDGVGSRRDPLLPRDLENRLDLSKPPFVTDPHHDLTLGDGGQIVIVPLPTAAWAALLPLGVVAFNALRLRRSR